MSTRDPHDDLPDVRDGLTHRERIVLRCLHELQFDCCVLANARRTIICLGSSVAWQTKRQRDLPLSARVGVAHEHTGSTPL
jgi:hypothetical protein